MDNVESSSLSGELDRLELFYLSWLLENIEIYRFPGGFC